MVGLELAKALDVARRIWGAGRVKCVRLTKRGAEVELTAWTGAASEVSGRCYVAHSLDRDARPNCHEDCRE